MRRRDFLKTAPLLAAPSLAAPALAQGRRPLRFVPQANLSVLDPVWTSAVIVYNHAYLVYDTLYGYDGVGEMRPQMCAGHETSADELTWTFTLRDGLKFHDGEPVLARDCAQSIRRWGSRDSFGQRMIAATEEIVALDDKRFQIRLKKRFRQMLFGLGGRQCFVMPERIAKLPGTEQLKDTTGSGPFRFLPNEWVSGVRAAYARNDAYVPRQEKAAFFAGGKVAHFDRVEWNIQPDPATAAAALQQNEVDWIEQPLIDLVPMLKKSPGVTVKVVDPGGWVMFMAINHLYPPFDNAEIRRAIWLVLDQKAYIDSVVGDQQELGRTPNGFFSPSMPMASEVGLDILRGPRNVAKAREIVANSGYKGEPVVILAPTDQATQGQMPLVTRDMFLSMGLKVDLQSMDWGSVVARRASQKPPSEGGWHVFISVGSSLTAANPGSFLPLRGSGRQGWFGWATDPRLEELREAWFDAPDLASQRAIAEKVQLQALESVPFVPLGHMQQPAAFRSDIVDILPTAFPVFWNVRRV